MYEWEDLCVVGDVFLVALIVAGVRSEVVLP